MPFISFVIPYHNESLAMLQECIASIYAVALDADEREVIVVDDGSTLSPESFLKENFPDVIYVWQQNQGLSVARNTGIQRSTGMYLQFVDSDDTLIPEAYNDIVRSLKTDGMDMLMFRFTYNPERYRRATVSSAYNGAEYLLDNNLRAAVCAYTFKKEILGDLRFRPGIFHEDSLFTPQLMLKASTLHVTTTQAYFYRQHQGTIMSCKDADHIVKRLDDSLLVIKELSMQAKEDGTVMERAMYRCVLQQVMCYIYFIVILTRSISVYRKRTAELRRLGLYPMPVRRYTIKYYLFSVLTKCI